MLNRRIPLVLAVGGVLLAAVVACSGGANDGTIGDGDATAVTTSVAQEPDVPAATAATLLTPAGGATASSTPALTPTGAPTASGSSCELYEERWVVWGVSAGDVLNVREGPGVSNPIVKTLLPQALDVRACYDAEDVDGSTWRAVIVDGEMGWVNVRFLKLEGSDLIELAGEVRPRLRAASETVRLALAAADFERLAEFCDEDRGIQFSTDAYVNDDDPVLTCANLRAAAVDSTVIRWGFTDGAGFPIDMTVAERLGEIAGSWALTSTDELAFDVRVGTGNTIDNLAEAFPGSAFVEYHSRGTSRFPGFDWSSVRLVFDTSDENSPVLLAIVEDMWTV